MPHKIIDKLLVASEYLKSDEAQKQVTEKLGNLELPSTKQEEYQNTDFSDVFDSINNVAFGNMGFDYIENEDAHIITIKNNAENVDIDTSALSVKIVDIQEENDDNHDSIATISGVLANKSVIISLADNTDFDKVVIVTNQIGIVGSDLYASDIKINVGKNSKAQIIVYEEQAHTGSLFLGNNSVELSENSHVGFYHLLGNKDSKLKSAIIKQQFFLDKNTHLQAFNLSLSGRKCRIESDINIRREGSHADIQGIAFLTDEQLLDNHVFVNHLAPNCTSNQLFKYIIGGKAQGVFSGLINIVPNSQRVEAYQRNNNILLTDTAKMHTKPQLIIDADDVKCSHGASTGQIDEQALFYMRSRGINESEARSMLIDAFLDEVIGNIALPLIREQVRSCINNFS
ncbi:MAG: Fe-S cluster assembly protein SufD [Bacteroidales bacterium]